MAARLHRRAPAPYNSNGFNLEGRALVRISLPASDPDARRLLHRNPRHTFKVIFES